jgi:hypothetical protein
MKANGRAALLGVNDTMTHVKATRKCLETPGWECVLNRLLGRLAALRLCRDDVEPECAGVGPVVVKRATAFWLILLSPV